MEQRLRFVCPECGSQYEIIRSTGPRQLCPSCGYEPSIHDLLAGNELRRNSRSWFGIFIAVLVLIGVILGAVAVYVQFQ